jgi:hypothetical protein
MVRIGIIFIILLFLCLFLFILVLFGKKNNILKEFYSEQSTGYRTIGLGKYNKYSKYPKACSKRNDCNSKNCLKSGVCSPV